MNPKSVPLTTSDAIKDKLWTLYEELFQHDGYGELQLEMRTLNRGQKEVIISCGKQHRYIVNFLSRATKAGHGTGKCRAAERRRADLPYEGPDRRRGCRSAGNPAAEGQGKTRGKDMQ